VRCAAEATAAGGASGAVTGNRRADGAARPDRVSGSERCGERADAYRRAVVDRYLRPWKARAYAPLLRPLAAVPVDAVTAVGVAAGLAAAAAAAVGRFDWALVGWWANRWLDGLDGELARAAARRRAAGVVAPARGVAAAGQRTAPTHAAAISKRGAYLDLMADLLVYAAVPLGLAAGAAGSLTGVPLADPAWVWAAAALALASFYLNLGSWALLAPALAAAEAADASGAAGAAETADAASTGSTPVGQPPATPDPNAPGLRMPAGLMEGAETIVVFTVALAWPAWAATTLATIGALTLAGALQRTAWGLRRLGRTAA